MTSDKPLITIEDVRRINQKMIDKYKDNKMRGRIMSIDDLKKLKIGTVLKAVDKLGHSIIFDFSSFCLDGYNIFYINHFVHLENKAPIGFEESKRIACDYTCLQYLDVVNEDTALIFHETVEYIKENCPVKDKKSVEMNDKLLSREALKGLDMIDKVLIGRNQGSTGSFMIRFRGISADGSILSDEKFCYENCRTDIFKSLVVAARYYDLEELAEADSNLECMFCEQISAETHKNNNTLDYKTVRKYQPGEYMYVRTAANERYLFRWGYFDFNNNKIMALGNIHCSYYSSGYTCEYRAMMFEEIHGNREELQFRPLHKDYITIAEIRHMTPLEYEFYEYELRQYYKSDDPYSENDVAGTPEDQTFYGVLIDGTLVKFILADSYTSEETDSDDLLIVPALPYKRMGQNGWIWTSELDNHKRTWAYKDFKWLSYASKSEDYFFKEEYWLNGGSHRIKHCWSLVMPNDSKHQSSKNSGDGQKKIVSFKDDGQMRPFVTKVLMCKGHGHRWIPAIFGYKGFCDGTDKLGYVAVGGESYAYCVPYQKNKEYVGKTFCHADFE